jgi:sialate O-acetylesterase
MSMIGCTYATDYQKRVKIPVGLIQSYQGSTPIETWMPLEAVQKVEPDAHPPADEPPLIAGSDLSLYFRKFKPLPPGGMYNAMIWPLVRFPIKGVLWYQGENNAGRPMHYAQLLTGLIASWREKWGLPDLPFVIDQLSSTGTVLKNDATKEQWAWLREQQQNVVDATPQTGLTVIYDLGEYGDTHSHAKPPQAVRMLDTYFSFSTGGPKQLGPRYTTSSVNGGQIRVNFETHGHGLVATEVVMNKNPGLPAGTDPDAFRTTPGTLTGFTICGADHHFVDATAIIDSTSVVVSSPMVSQPVAVRYAWADFTLANLFDDAGYPAAPFRTDTFPPPAALTAPHVQLEIKQ